MLGYKLRIYKTRGIDKGNLDHEEYFDSLDELQIRYRELFKRELYSLNPTGWEWVDNTWNLLFL